MKIKDILALSTEKLSTYESTMNEIKQEELVSNFVVKNLDRIMAIAYNGTYPDSCLSGYIIFLEDVITEAFCNLSFTGFDIICSRVRGETLRAIGKRLHVSPERIRQQETKAFNAVRKKIRVNGLYREEKDLKLIVEQQVIKPRYQVMPHLRFYGGANIDSLIDVSWDNGKECITINDISIQGKYFTKFINELKELSKIVQTKKRLQIQYDIGVKNMYNETIGFHVRLYGDESEDRFFLLYENVKNDKSRPSKKEQLNKPCPLWVDIEDLTKFIKMLEIFNQDYLQEQLIVL